jgi:ABC-type multidrug transport system fused ATPase/permease subunit
MLDPALKKFLSYAKPYKWLVLVATICGLLKYNIPVIFPWVFKDIIDYLISNNNPGISFIHNRIIFLFGLFIFWMIITYYRSYLADSAGQHIIFNLRNELYVHLQRMSLSFYEKHQIGSISSRLLGDIAIAQNFIGAAFTNTLMDISAVFLITICMFKMNHRLAIISLSILPLYILFNKLFKTKMRKTSKMSQEKMEEIAGAVHERLRGISIIQSYTREKVEERLFFHKNREYLDFRIANIKNNALTAAVVGFLTSIAPVIVVWYGAIQVLNHSITVGELTAFFAYLGMFYSPLNRLTELNILLTNSHAAIERIYEIFITMPEIKEKQDALDIQKVEGGIIFNNVSFKYNSSGMILKNINISIPHGKTFALVGQSGAGKSTFIKLIPRFYDIAEGQIKIDGINVSDFQLKSLRSHIAIVLQDPILFSGTIKENILIGKPDASDDEIIKAAYSANAFDFISRLPKGFDTDIGEGGMMLSGGQRQRVALARAFLKNAPILILDEATSSLDSESENLIQDALKQLMQGRTTIIIAHRLSTIQAADQIVVFQHGEIVERGKHFELIQKSKSIYKKLYHEQFQKLESAYH